MLQSGALWNTEQVHGGICEISLLCVFYLLIETHAQFKVSGLYMYLIKQILVINKLPPVTPQFVV